MDLRSLATLLSESAEADRAAVATALDAAGYGEPLREVEDACRRTGESDPLAALDELGDADPRRREVAAALSDNTDDAREVIARIWSPRAARLRQLGKVAGCADPLDTVARWERAGKLVDALLALPEEERIAAVRAHARLRAPLVVWRLLEVEERRRFESAEEALRLAQLACAAIGAERIPFRREASLETDTAALCKAVEANALRMLGDLSSASQLLFVAVGWLRRNSDPFVAGEVHSLRGSLELDLGENLDADRSFKKSLAFFGDGFPGERQRDLLKLGICKDLRNESGRSEFQAVFAEVFNNPVFERILREKAAINLSLCEIYYHDVADAERRLHQLTRLLPENELWRTFAQGLINEYHGDLSSAESLFRHSAAGFLKRELANPWALVLLHACHARCQRGELPGSEIRAVADYLAISKSMRGGAAQAARLCAACADHKAAAQMIGSVLFSLRCPHATNR